MSGVGRSQDDNRGKSYGTNNRRTDVKKRLPILSCRSIPGVCLQNQSTSFFQNPKKLVCPRKPPPVVLRLLYKSTKKEFSARWMQHDDLE